MARIVAAERGVELRGEEGGKKMDARRWGGAGGGFPAPVALVGGACRAARWAGPRQRNNPPARDRSLRPTDQNNRARLLPAGAPGLLWRDWSIAPGVAISSDPQLGFSYTLAFRKQPQAGARARMCTLLSRLDRKSVV